MGLSDQVGNEIDEFVTNTLRNNLLGLPLDLPAINMTRARSEGIPSLNNVRKQIFAPDQRRPAEAVHRTGSTSARQLKHPESLVNFVAAYGTHPTITRRGHRSTAARPRHDRSSTARSCPAGRRPGRRPADPGRRERGQRAPAGRRGRLHVQHRHAGRTPAARPPTGLDDIDLWVGGLAEHTNLFGGLLGTTFNYVFENQLTNLQNGDRFYYLARTPGMNLRAQLEGNSFAELIMRNTTAHTLKADPFATADCKFELGNLTSPATSWAARQAHHRRRLGAGRPGVGVRRERAAAPDGRRHDRATARPTPPMPSGINAQAVYNGTRRHVATGSGAATTTTPSGVARATTSSRVVTAPTSHSAVTATTSSPTSPATTCPRAVPATTPSTAAPASTSSWLATGNDFTNGGANSNEHFLGAGDDFAIAGQGIDAIFGDSGDDWEEGGDQPDLLIGDSSSFFFDDHNVPGHDILIGQGGDDDYDLEGGDDIGVAGPGVEKNAGAAGFDWEIGLGDPQAAGRGPRPRCSSPAA